MALDICIVTTGNDKIHLEMSEFLHSAIFSATTRWSSQKSLQKIKDYYKTNVDFRESDAIAFVNALKEISRQVDCETKLELESLLVKLDGKDLLRIRITGD